MKNAIQSILNDLVAIDSITSSAKENAAAGFIYNYLLRIPYFKKNPQHLLIRQIAGDPLRRDIVLALVQGESSRTVILAGHYDVVGIDDYGPLQAYAFSPQQLPSKLRELRISEEVRQDLESGEWLFGRGVADMKGGLAVCLDYLQEYAAAPREGSLLLLAVPDEESYSLGMREAAAELVALRELHGLDYKLLINAEPNRREGGKHVVSLGTAGKCLPVVLAQGKQVHTSACFSGLNPVGILAGVFSQTELSLDFSDISEGEISVPPTWLYFRDMKENYDVSLPLLAGGYLSVVSLNTTPDQLLERLKQVTEQVFRDYIAKMERIYAQYRAAGPHQAEYDMQLEPCVMSYGELVEHCRSQNPQEFEHFYLELYQDVQKRLANDELNYPQATMHMMREVLAFSQISAPLALLGLAPPYYPAMLSKKIAGKEEFTGKCFKALRRKSLADYGLDMVAENYTLGLSDCSYAAVNKPLPTQALARDMPLWGKLYNIDFEAIEKLNAPCMILGPYGKDLHQMTERVHIFDLCERLPDLIRCAAEYAFTETPK